MRKLLIILTCILSCILNTAAPIAAQQRMRVNISQLNVSAFPSAITNSIVQDEQGFIWVGTDQGLCQFDGYSVRTFSKSQYPQLASNRISALNYDRSRNILWIGTWRGLSYLDLKQEKICRVEASKQAAVRSLMLDQQGQLWVGSNTGLATYQFQKGKLLRNNLTQNLPHHTVRCVANIDQNSVWVGTYNGLSIYHNALWEKVEFPKEILKNATTIGNDLILSILPIIYKKQQAVAVGTQTGLRILDEAGHELAYYNQKNSALSNEVIKSMLPLENKLLLGTDFGLNILDLNSGQVQSFYHDPEQLHSLPSNIIRALFQDKYGMIWLMTDDGIGLLQQQDPAIRFHPVFYSDHGIKSGNHIKSMALMSGKLWMATEHGLISETLATHEHQYLTAEKDSRARLNLDQVNVVRKSPADQLWIGTSAGINIWDPATEHMQSIRAGKENGLQSNYIADLMITAQEQLVSAWEGGVFSAQKGQRHLFKKIGDYSGAQFIATPSSKLIFHDHAYYQYIDGQIQPLEWLNKLLADVPVTFAGIAHKNCLYIGSEGKVYQFDLHQKRLLKIIHYPLPQPMPIINLAIDRQGGLWGTTAHVFFKVEADHCVIFPLVQVYSAVHLHANCAFISPDNMMYIGGKNGYLSIDIDQLNYPNKIPQLKISRLKINGKMDHARTTEINDHRNITLHHDASSVKIELSNFMFTNPANQTFTYQLAPLDQRAHILKDGDNAIAYSHLPAGKYQLSINSYNQYGITNTKPMVIQLSILPPWWKSVPALAGYFLLFLLLAGTGIYIYLREERLKNAMKIAQLNQQHIRQDLENRQTFMVNISHELKTPLSLIGPPLRSIVHELPLNDQQRELFNISFKNIDRLQSLSSQILEYQMVESGVAQLTPVPVELVAFLQTLLQAFTHLADRKQIQLKLDTNLPTFFCALDTQKLETILLNLLGNAMKFTPQGGAVVLGFSAQPADQQITLTVTDNGIGIGEAQKAKIFDLFYQTEKGKSVAEGTGIGLAMVRQFVQLMQGSVTVTSEQGQGSCFSLRLPVELSKQTHTRTDKPAGTSVMPNTEKPMGQKLLLVDDNEDILSFLSLSLKADYELHFAYDGLSAVEQAKTILPDLILMDVMMPIMDGFEACEKIRNIAELQAVPIVFLTAKGAPEDQLKSVLVGGDSFIAKPFDLQFLKEKIKRILRKDQAVRDFMQSQSQSPIPTVDPADNQDYEFMHTVLHFIEEHLSEETLNVQLVADKMNISSTHLYRKVKDIDGRTPKELITVYRMEKAGAMIRNNEGNITDIMYAVGFSSRSTFSKSFKAYFGLAPSKYKQGE
ncbi:hybrid sensor histidine kinase/response regulator transcription factor [Persicobacter psychrovividus]|uniref:histidine kinase n=1 Tax=Persicobacter psychrovividus TaxID=387638 RepID=A0ABN6LC38_9BACT|nr:hypothetical protein PEPS_28570 [Persicobacter psychrovividus]